MGDPVTVTRYVIRRKDGLYIGRNADHVDIFEAELFGAREEAVMGCFDDNEEAIPVRVTIEEGPASSASEEKGERYVCKGCGTEMGTNCFTHIRDGIECGPVVEEGGSE
jgi:hypothetical protein